jgi:hypothetical protein
MVKRSAAMPDLYFRTDTTRSGFGGIARNPGGIKPV